jgi:hypothetical protein
LKPNGPKNHNKKNSTQQTLNIKVKLLDKCLPTEKLENVSRFIDNLSGTFYANGILVGDHISP